jgi:dihydroorotate dehydrogenase electron transfer subunit
MARKQTATLRYVRPSPPNWEAYLALGHPPQPGMYVLADLGGPLREALLPAAVEEDGFATVISPGHPLRDLLPGTVIDVLGPLGRGFRIASPGHSLARLLLIAEMDYLPWLLPLTQAASSVVLVIEATTRGRLPPPTRFPPALELLLVTLDGSAGYLGPLEADGAAPSGMERARGQLQELVAWADRICIAVTPDRYPDLAHLVNDVRLQPQPDFAQALVRVPMPCGMGVCDVCRVTTRRGEIRTCVDGPVLDLLDFLHD